MLWMKVNEGLSFTFIDNFLYNCLSFILAFNLLTKPLNVSPVLVISLKRLLVGSISLSEDSQPDEENGEEPSERPSQEIESCQSTGRLSCFLFLFFIVFFVFIVFIFLNRERGTSAD